MKKLILNVSLLSMAVSTFYVNANEQIKYDDQYFKEIESFFIKLQARYPLSICKDQVS
jgi:hypothetical protein